MNSGRVTWPVVGAISAAVAASACCLVPAVLALLGVSGVGFASRLAPYRIPFLILSALSLAAGFWFAYRPPTGACDCGTTKSRRTARVGLWITTLLTIALAAYPMLRSGSSAVAGGAEAEAKASLELDVIGMDCKECTSTIANAVKKVPGVVSVAVDFESGNAVVRYDGREGMADAAISAVERAGYRAKVKQ